MQATPTACQGLLPPLVGDLGLPPPPPLQPHDSEAKQDLKNGLVEDGPEHLHALRWDMLIPDGYEA